MKTNTCLAFVVGLPLMLATACAIATPFFFSTGDPNGLMGMASRPSSAGKFEIESADDFSLSQQTTITNATFTGLLTGSATAASINYVGVEIYHVFPNDSNVGGTSGSPTFSTAQVPTRVNSPSDVAFVTRDSGGTLSFSANTLNAIFTVNNSVQPGGIHPKPNQTTLGNGPATGMEVEFDLTFLSALDLPADHYFFVPLVGLSTGEFLWLSAPKPIVSPGTAFSPDLQTWTRDEFLDPDWLRVGTDIVGGTVPPTFNAAFSLTGETGAGSSIPEPRSLFLIVAGSLALLVARRRQVVGSQ